ncbi:MAG: hypothetical protein Q4D89_06055 [Arachnia propionica]|uniref:hypothetical protein n=1 Tax=Arachnia propionica TaxID=1750 RepID=UPI0026F771C0|nr:hypothetical protein [Arachnia propionica]
MAVDQDRGVVAFHITADQAGDSPEFTAVLEVIKVANPVGAPRRRPDRVLADKAYSLSATPPPSTSA